MREGSEMVVVWKQEAAQGRGGGFTVDSRHGRLGLTAEDVVEHARATLLSHQLSACCPRPSDLVKLSIGKLLQRQLRKE